MKQTFTILHTNDMHSAFIGMAPAADYNPPKPNDDQTRGGYACLAGLIARRREARKDLGPVLVLPTIPLDERATEVRAIKTG